MASTYRLYPRYAMFFVIRAEPGVAAGPARDGLVGGRSLLQPTVTAGEPAAPCVTFTSVETGVRGRRGWQV